jgi:hypothetical protein
LYTLFYTLQDVQVELAKKHEAKSDVIKQLDELIKNRVLEQQQQQQQHQQRNKPIIIM